MELKNTFRVGVAPAEAFAFLIDLERVARCMPGAKLTGRDGDAYRGDLQLRAGPVRAAYSGTVTLQQVDERQRQAVLRASGSEVGGQGSAEAMITAAVAPDGDRSIVTVETDLQIRGRAAQFGRGVIGDVAQRIIDQFAANLEATLAQGPLPASVPSGREAAPEGPAVAGRPAPAAPADELDAWSVVVLPLLRRAAPVLAALVAGLALGRLGRARRTAPWPGPAGPQQGGGPWPATPMGPWSVPWPPSYPGTPWPPPPPHAATQA